MKNKNTIITQLENYKKSYEETRDFETFKSNLHNIIVDVESITPVSPFYSSYIFHTKLDYENIDRQNAGNLVFSLKTFLERLDP